MNQDDILSTVGEDRVLYNCAQYLCYVFICFTRINWTKT